MLGTENDDRRGTSPVITIIGGKNSGKSTLNRYLINSLLDKVDRVYFLECDVGQTEFTPPGCVSLHCVSEPVLGVTPADDPTRYLTCIEKCFSKYVDLKEKGPLIVNTCGWNKDASPKAYGAAAYLSNENETTLVMAKTRVAPVKCLTLPQLELMAAIIGARLAAHLHSTLNYPKIVFWSDSSIVLHWLTSTKTLKRFIANRVKEITELTHPYKWRYCPTDNNPADLLTRGLTIEQFDQSIL
ncbi:unnamed protein product [Mytilus edulis]|uniref:Clp1 P-loop domain-containing protein n=1 Tax=Mytilus edulis TaxID=6550 RepID=A0A8S3RVT3_MYTED|nr:unnamed protein product [Mytilus edulis]